MWAAPEVGDRRATFVDGGCPLDLMVAEAPDGAHTALARHR